ncbi:uncharacterized protein F5147DRAFT_589933, partial [Suillus discolor]
YSTLARIAMDICAISTSLVLCKQLFSGGAETTTAHCSYLSAKHFEQLQMLKFS